MFHGCNGRFDDLNRFPLPRLEFVDPDCREVTGVPFTVAIPSAPTTPPPPSK